MSQSALTIRLDTDLKNQFDALCEDFGMSTNTAFNIYVRTVVREKRIPFPVESSARCEMIEKGRQAFYRLREQAKEAGLQEMSLDEINEEIKQYREQ